MSAECDHDQVSELNLHLKYMLMIAYTHYETDPRVMRAAEAAREGNFEVDVIALWRSGQPPVELVRGVRVFHLQPRYRGKSRLKYFLHYLGFFMKCAWKVSRLSLQRRYKVVHVHNMPDALVFTALVPKLLGAKVILDIHDPMLETYASKYDSGVRSNEKSLIGALLLLEEKISVAFADSTITVSEPFKNGILGQRGYRSETIIVVANFADEDLFCPIEYPSFDHVIRFVFHGTIVERYGLGLLLDAVKECRNRDRVRIRIIGEGDFSTVLSSRIREYGLGDVVEFQNCMYPLRDIPKVLSDCHVGLIPLDVRSSRVADFALPLKLVEYACLGIPSITVRNAAIEYYFRPDECMFFDSGDSRALAHLLDSVAEEPGCLLGYRKQLDNVRLRLSWRREREKYKALLAELVAS